MPTPATRTPIKIARGSYSNLNSSIDDLQEGELVYATDQDSLYVKEGSSLISVSTGLLDEDDFASDSATQAASQQSVKAYVAANSGTTNLTNTANGTSLTIESSSGSNTTLPAATTSAWGVMTDEDKNNLDANTLKTSNATHTGDVTGATSLTIADDAVTYAKIQNVTTTDRVLGRDSSGAGVIEEISPSALRTMINVADGAEANVNADWNSSSGASQIANKPTLATSATTDTTNASNIDSGTLPIARIADDAVTYAKIQDVSATNRVLGRDSADAGVIEEISPSALRTMINVEDGANDYSHPTTAGNLHIPSGGTEGQFLKYDSAGTAIWAVDNNTTYNVVDSSANGLAPQLPGAHGGKFLKADGIWEVPPNTQVAIDDTPVDGVTDEAISSNWAYDHNAATGNSAHVPAAGSSGEFLKHDGTWGTPAQRGIDDTPVDGETSESITSNWAYDHNAATGNSAHVPAAGSSGEFLAHNGAWATPVDTSKMPLTGGTFTGSVTFEDAINENVFAITDATSPVLEPDNGMIQTWTLNTGSISGDRTPSDSIAAGQSMLLMLDDGDGTDAVSWPTMTWVGGSAPTLATSGYTVIELWKVGGTLYGSHVGDVA